MAYGTRYRCEWADIYGSLFYFDIEQDGYTGSITSLTGGDVPFNIESRQQNNDPFEPVIGRSATFNVIGNEGFSLSSIYTQVERFFRVTVYEGSVGSGLVIFQGWLMTLDVREDYQDEPYGIVFRGYDGIGALKNIAFRNNSGGSISGRVSLLYIIRQCLYHTGLSLDLYTAFNTYQQGDLNGGEYDPLAGTFVSARRFYVSETTPMNCFDVLEKTLSALNMRVFQFRGAWHALSVVEQAATFYYRRRYNSSGTLLTHGVATSTPELGRAGDFIPTGRDAVDGFNPAYASTSLFFDYGTYSNIAPNPFFAVGGSGLPDEYVRVGLTTPETAKVGTGTDTDPFALRIRGETDQLVTDTKYVELTDWITVEPLSVLEITTELKNFNTIGGKLMILADDNNGNVIYLDKYGKWWRDTPKVIIIENFTAGNEPKETAATVSILADKLPIYPTVLTQYTRLKVRFYRGIAKGGTVTTPYVDYSYLSIIQKRGEEYKEAIGESHTVVTLPVPSYLTKSEQTVFIGDQPFSATAIGALYRANGSTRSQWWVPYNSEFGFIFPLLRLMAEQRQMIYSRPQVTWEGSFIGHGGMLFTPELNGTGFDGKRLLITSEQIDYKNKITRITGTEIFNEEPALQWRQVFVYEGDRTSPGGSGGSGFSSTINVTGGPTYYQNTPNITGVEPGTYGTETDSIQFEIDESGRIIDAENVPIFFPGSIREVTLSEDLPAGAYVHLVQGEDVVNAYGAIANNTGRWAHGFIKVAGVAGDVVMAYGTGHVNESTVVQIGADWDTRDWDDSDWLTNLESDIIAGVHYYLSPTDKGKVTPVLPYSGAIQLVGQGVQRGGLQFVYHEAAAYSGTGDGVRFFTHNTDGELEYKLFNYQPFSQRLTDIADNLQANGFLAYVDETYTIEARSITGIEGEIVVANGNGVGANPEIGLAESGVTPTETDGFTVDSKGRVTAIDTVEVGYWSQAYDDNVIAAAVTDFGTNAKVLMLTKRSLEQYESAPFSFPINTGQASSLVSSDTGNIGSIWYTDRSVFFRNSSNQTIELKQIAEPVAEEPTALARTGVDFSYNYALSNIQTSLPSTISMISWPDWTNEPTIGANSILISALSAEIPNKPGRTYPVVFRVTNGDGQSRTFTIRIQISDTATAPTVANAIPDQTGTVGTLFQYTIPSNTFLATTGHSIIQFSASVPTGAGWLVYDSATRKFTGTPPSAQTLQIAVVGTDTQGLSITDIFLITVSTGSANDPIPAVYDVADSNFTTVLSDGTVGQHVVNDNISAWDVSAPVDGSYRVTVIYRWGGDDMGYQVDSKVGTWSAISTTGVGPTNTALTQFDISLLTGAHTIYFRGTGDTSAFYNIQSVTIQLIQGGTNIAPRIANQPPTLTGRQNIAFDATLTSPIFVDDDGTVVSITASGLPTGLSYSNGRITGTPTGSGSSVVTLTATDDDAATSTTQFLIIINAEVVISTGTTEVFATFSF